MDRTLTKEEFVEKARKVHGDKYDYSKFVYVNSATKGIIICPKHGDIYQKPNGHLNGRGCFKCHGMKLTNAERIENLKIKHKNIYDYSLVKFTNNKGKINIICKKHGIFSQAYSDHFNGCGCPKCGKDKSRLTHVLNNNSFIEKSIKIHKNEYDYSLVEYGKNNTVKVKIICKKHGVFYQTPHVHLRGNGCPFCSESIGEKRIRLFLEERNINTKGQKTFPNCKDKYKLRFDFFLYDYNLLIEYNGIGHYKIIRYNGISLKNAIKSYNSTIKTDNIKNEYCRINNIPLLTIKYTDFINIEKILKEEIYNIFNNIPSNRIKYHTILSS